MNTQQLIEKMRELLNTIVIEHDKTTAKSKNLARKASSELKKMAAEYKRQSTLENKK